MVCHTCGAEVGLMEMLHSEELEPPDVEAMNRAGRIAAQTHEMLESELEVGVSPKDLNRMATQFIQGKGAEPAFYDYRETNHAITVSINEQAIHTPPTDRVIESGDIVSIDLGAKYEGHYSDTAVTHIAGEAREPEHEELVERTKASLNAGILEATAGNTLQDVGKAIEEKSGSFGNVTGWAGHFIGRELHLKPQVFNTAEQNEPYQLVNGMCLAIEPILSLSSNSRTLERATDRTVRTHSKEPAAHFEHTIRVGRDRAEILTARSDEPDSL